jgi:hypothetical protein
MHVPSRGRIVGVERGSREGNIEELQGAPSGKKGGQLQKAGMSAVCWEPPTDLTFTQWMSIGKKFGVIGRGSGWWIGDWVRYGAKRYGGRYKVAMKVTGYDEQTLMNMVWVAGKIEISRRRENLSFSHHAEVAALEVEDQERFLDRAAQERLNVRQLRNEVAAGRLSPAAPIRKEMVAELLEQAGEGAGAEGVVEDASVCPNCGRTL